MYADDVTIYVSSENYTQLSRILHNNLMQDSKWVTEMKQ